ncbi:aspartate carbamoyltransferase [Tribonema minus]|uniref:aspartate carbamoyltransferase n=1 Tax=Tribonema minus TaxID=303371 RepID=A0A835ZFC3_9STRA|nr:aspartate carbamoyltransferase [Tribonema minus]
MEKYVPAPARAVFNLLQTNFTADAASWEGKCIISVKQFGLESLAKLFEVADEMKKLVKESGGDQRLQGRLLATLFFENSTRTCCSLQAAMLRLGGSVVSVNETTSSVKKGETLQDTIACLCSYCDVVALRHPQQGAAVQAVTATRRPLINAGDGVGEHPTQAILDVYTMVSELGGVEGKVITLVGDLKNGRTVHSLARLLALYACELHFVAPPALRMPEDVVRDVTARGRATVTQSDAFDAVLPRADVLYVTRVQKERFEDAAEYEALRLVYRVTPEVLARAKRDMVLMHPLPRVGEIAEDCDDDPRAAYVRQMENGMVVRMALLALLLGKA